jgi:hypothetical protein
VDTSGSLYWDLTMPPRGKLYSEDDFDDGYDDWEEEEEEGDWETAAEEVKKPVQVRSRSTIS